MRIIINKDKTNDFTLTAQRLYENLSPDGGSLSAEQSCTIADSQTPASYEGLAGMTVLTLEATTEDGKSIPIQGTYTKIEAVSVSYSEPSGLYVATVIFS